MSDRLKRKQTIVAQKASIILKTVMEVTGVSYKELIGDEKASRIANARGFIVRILIEELSLSYPEISPILRKTGNFAQKADKAMAEKIRRKRITEDQMEDLRREAKVRLSNYSAVKKKGGNLS